MILVGVSHLKIVAEHVVVAHLQRAYACLFGFALLQLKQIVLAGA